MQHVQVVRWPCLDHIADLVPDAQAAMGPTANPHVPADIPL